MKETSGIVHSFQQHLFSKLATLLLFEGTDSVPHSVGEMVEQWLELLKCILVTSPGSKERQNVILDMYFLLIAIATDNILFTHRYLLYGLPMALTFSSPPLPVPYPSCVTARVHTDVGWGGGALGLPTQTSNSPSLKYCSKIALILRPTTHT